MNTLLSLSLVASTTLIILWCAYISFIRRQDNIRVGRIAIIAIIILTLVSPALLLLTEENLVSTAETDGSISAETVSMVIIPQEVDQTGVIDESTPTWLPALAESARKVYLAGVVTLALAILISGLRLLHIIM